MPTELGALNQTHHRRRTLPRPQGTRKQPVVATDGLSVYAQDFMILSVWIEVYSSSP